MEEYAQGLQLLSYGGRLEVPSFLADADDTGWWVWE